MNGEQIDFIADTSALVGLLRGDQEVEKRILNKRFAITFVTLAELNLGVLKASKREAAWNSVRNLLRDRIMLHVSTVTPAIYARIYFELERAGTMIPINDIWIAALAIEAQLPILARDAHFARVTGLSLIQC
jgi:tRNA(fMet)-specific endonuclease VapC